jgi:recombination protein RecT
MATKTTEKKDSALAKNEEPTQTLAQRFILAVEREFRSMFGADIQWTTHQQLLGQHLFHKCDSALEAAEVKRIRAGKGGTPYTWENVNKKKLYKDVCHSIALGLDAFIPNHIDVIAYANPRTSKWDLDIRPGYAGKDFTRRTLALNVPKDIVYELIFDTDEFTPIKKDATNSIESYLFKITQPFNRGKVIGGFGYISYDDPTQNKLVIVTQRDFERAESSAPAKEFWTNHRQEMQFKTVVHRVCKHIPLDPQKTSLALVAALDAIDYEIDEEIEVEANARMLTTPDKSESPPALEPREANRSLDVTNYEPGADDLNETAVDEQAQAGLGY